MKNNENQFFTQPREFFFFFFFFFFGNDLRVGDCVRVSTSSQPPWHFPRALHKSFWFLFPCVTCRPTIGSKTSNRFPPTASRTVSRMYFSKCWTATVCHRRDSSTGTIFGSVIAKIATLCLRITR